MNILNFVQQLTELYWEFKSHRSNTSIIEHAVECRIEHAHSSNIKWRLNQSDVNGRLRKFVVRRLCKVLP